MMPKFALVKTFLLTASISSILFSPISVADDAAIKAIENKLLPKVLIEGKPVEYKQLEQRMQQLKLPGISIAVARDGKLAWTKSYGMANQKTNTPVSANTLFQAGSISKPIAALAALHLADHGKLKLDAPVNDYLKSWQVPDNELTKEQPVTLRHLLTHTGGLTVHGFPGYHTSTEMPSNVKVLNGIGNTDKVEVNVLPGSIWRYSGGGYTVMEQLVEDVSGMSLADYAQKHIFSTLALNNTTFAQPLPKALHEQASAAFDQSGKQIDGDWHNYPEQAAAGLWTTPTDLVNYALAMQRIYDGETKSVLSPSMVKQMLTLHKGDWGLGPALRQLESGLTFGHGGKNAGFTNNMIASVEPGTVFVVMANGDNANPLISDIMLTLSAHYGLDWFEQTSITPVKFADDFRAKIAGKYQFARDPGYIAEIDVSNEVIVIAVTYNGEPDGSYNFLPTNKQIMTNIESGALVTFRVNQEGIVEAFSWGTGGMLFNKLND